MLYTVFHFCLFLCVLFSQMCTQEGHTFVCRQKFHVIHNKIKDIMQFFIVFIIVI